MYFEVSFSTYTVLYVRGITVQLTSSLTGLESERWNIWSAYPITLFTHFKTNIKSFGIYRAIRCCVLLKIKIKKHEMGWAN